MNVIARRRSSVKAISKRRGDCFALLAVTLYFHHSFDFFQDRFQIWSVCRNDFIFPNVFVMRRSGQVWKVRRVVVTKDDCPIGALVMISIGLFDGLFLTDKKFPEVQERIVNEVHVDA